jgi:hypothetical protein
LSCTILLSFAVSERTSALTVEPFITTITSLTQFEKSKTTETKSEQKTAKSPDAANPAPSQSVAPTGDTVLEEQPPIVSEPLPELPVVETPSLYPTSIAVVRPVNVITISRPIVGSIATDSVDSITPLQATHQGWKIFGIVWYWWLFTGGGVYYTVRFFRHRRRRQSLADSLAAI